MRTRRSGSIAITALAITALALTACGGGGGAQDEVADMMMEAMADDGLAVDEDCVRGETSKLSDEDARTILDAGPDGDPDISDDAEAAVDAAVGCIDTSAMVDALIDEMGEEMGEENVDADCIRDATEGLDLATLDEGGGDLMGALFECISLGG